MNSVYRDKFYQIRKNINEFVGDGIIADSFILYDLYSYIYIYNIIICVCHIKHVTTGTFRVFI